MKTTMNSPGSRAGWKSAFLCSLLFLISFSLYAQQQVVEGTVRDSLSGDPLPGVSVKLRNAETGTSTDLEGRFSLEVNESNPILVVSFLGYRTQEVQARQGQPLDIRLGADNQALEEVVVIGYGTRRKRDITSAVSVIDAQKLEDRPISNINNLMLGQAPGVVVKQTAGTPGQELDVKIRGLSSLGAGSNPLYVIDGFAMGTSAGRNLNPADVESITVLKDAASTAIYGARGSNGVVLITTKSAAQNETSLSFTANYGVQNVPDSRRVEMMDGVEFAQFKKEAFMDRIRYFDGREPSEDEVPESFRHPEQTPYSTDWLGEILNENAPFQDYNVTLASGRGSVKSLVSVSYLNQAGALIETGFERFNARANLNGNINDNISFGWNIAGSYAKEQFAQTDGRDAVVGSALWADPREPVYNEDGSFNDYVGGNDGVFGIANPVQELMEMQRDRNLSEALTNGFVEFRFLKDFTFRSSVNARLTGERRKEFRPSFLAGRGFNQPPPREAYLDEFHMDVINVSADQVLNYNKVLGDHVFGVMAGYSAQEETRKDLSAGGDEFPNDIVRFLNVAERVDANSFEEGWSMLAYIARLNYTYKDKYLFTASYRREGSSRFGINNKWGNFPAVSLGWRLTEESFLQDKADWLADLKLRGSWGITGNNDIGNYRSLSVLNPANYITGGNFVSGQILGNFANSNLGWEQSRQLNVGLDGSLFNSRLNVTLEYYRKITTDMLLPLEIPSISGFTSTFSNIGKVENKGVELALGYQTSIKEVNLFADFNIAFNRNKVLEINGENDEIRSGSMYSVYNVSKPGRPIAMLHGFRMLGIFNTQEEIDNWAYQLEAIPGVYKMEDTNGDGVISYDTQDMVEIGNPHPKFVWGLTLGGDYRRFDLSILLTGMQDYDLFRNIEATTMNMDGVFNVLKSAQNRWRSAQNPGDGVGPTTNHWRWQRESNSRYVYDASHMWLKNVSIGYTLPKAWHNARIFLSADNLLLVTSYPGNNPDIDRRGGINVGVDDEAYPVPRTFTIGASVKF